MNWPRSSYETHTHSLSHAHIHRHTSPENLLTDQGSCTSVNDFLAVFFGFSCYRAYFRDCYQLHLKSFSIQPNICFQMGLSQSKINQKRTNANLKMEIVYWKLIQFKQVVEKQLKQRLWGERPHKLEAMSSTGHLPRRLAQRGCFDGRRGRG